MWLISYSKYSYELCILENIANKIKPLLGYSIQILYVHVPHCLLLKREEQKMVTEAAQKMVFEDEQKMVYEAEQKMVFED